jgi:hypothetical protein
MLQKVQKNIFFCDVTKVENFDKKCLTLSKKNKKSPFKHFCFGRSKSPVKGLRNLQFCTTYSVVFYFYKIILKVLDKSMMKWLKEVKNLLKVQVFVGEPVENYNQEAGFLT